MAIQNTRCIFKVFKINNRRFLSFISLIIFCSGLPFCTALYAGGFQVYEFGTPILGTAAVGQAVTRDASTSYLNPAAMSQLEDSEVLLGSELIITRTRFAANNQNTFRGNNGGNAGGVAPGLGIFAVYSATPDLKFGLGLASPFGGNLDYNNGWVGRYLVQTTTLITLDLSPSISYSLNDCFAIGAGVFLEYAKLNETIGIPAVPALHAGDGQADLRLHHYAPGFNLGVLFTPSCETAIGLSYRSRVHHHLKGDTTFLVLDRTPGTTAIIKLPQSLIASFSQDITDRWNLLAELGWSNWRIFQSTVITIENITLTVPRKWKDTYRFGLGSRFKLTPDLLWQVGASYDTSPTKAENRLPDLPMDKQLRLGTGIVYRTCEAVEVGLNYEYINFGKAPIHKRTAIGTLSGHYSRNLGHFLGVSLAVKL